VTVAETDLAEALLAVITRVDMVARAQAEVLRALEAAALTQAAQTADLERIIRYLEFLDRQAQ
jgi:hypothetical protein